MTIQTLLVDCAESCANFFPRPAGRRQRERGGARARQGMRRASGAQPPADGLAHTAAICVCVCVCVYNIYQETASVLVRLYQ